MRRAAVLLLAAALAGCGNDRTPVPDLARPADPQGDRVVVLGAADLQFTAPANWTVLPPLDRMPAGIRSGTATLAVWHYPRTEPLPEGEEALEAAKARLEAEVRERDPGFQLDSSRVRRRAGADAIELTGRQTIAGQPRAVRSSHIFRDGAEVVVDAYAPPEEFARVDAAVFQPVLKSLERAQR